MSYLQNSPVNEKAFTAVYQEEKKRRKSAQVMGLVD